jgi:glutamate formiminotransferase
VVPFVPVSGISLAECAMLARQAGLQIWRRYGVPVYFYGAAAARPDRVQLEDVRRGQFEGLREASLRDAARRPDVGGPELHPVAGASAVGARSFLIAYNLYIQSSSNSRNEAAVVSLAAAESNGLHGLQHAAHKGKPLQPDIAAARAIARDLRASNGGLRGVKALGMMVNGRAQISMNITDFRATPMRTVYQRAMELAEHHGVTIGDGELIGLIPEDAFEPDSDWVRQTIGLDPEMKVLERKLQAPLLWPS